MLKKEHLDLVTANPQLAKEWNYDKNGNLKPEDYTPGSSKRVWWKCDKDHEWKAVISSRNTGVGCPYCAGKRAIKGVNDFATLHQELLKEWDYDRNTQAGIEPDEMLIGSQKRFTGFAKIITVTREAFTIN